MVHDLTRSTHFPHGFEIINRAKPHTFARAEVENNNTSISIEDFSVEIGTNSTIDSNSQPRINQHVNLFGALTQELQ